MKRSLFGCVCVLAFIGLTGCAPGSSYTVFVQTEAPLTEQEEPGNSSAALEDEDAERKPEGLEDAERKPEDLEETERKPEDLEKAKRRPENLNETEGKPNELEAETLTYSATMKYKDILLYDEAEPGKVCIRIDPPIIRERLSYFYIPTGEEQETLTKMIDGLEVKWEKHDQRWEGMKETGWMIVYNDMKFNVFDGGYLYSQDSDEINGSMEFLAQEEELCDMIQKMLERELDYGRINPSKIQGVVSATLEMKSMRTNFELLSQTITDEETLALFEDWLSGAKYIYGGADCGNRLATLKLTLADGEAVTLTLATDSCPNFGLNGVYYDYRPKKYRSTGGWYNDKLFRYFDEIPLPEYMQEKTEIPAAVKGGA